MNNMKLFLLAPGFLAGFLALQNAPKQAKTFDGKFFASSEQMVFTDATAGEIDSYYGDVTGLNGMDLISHLYEKIHIPTADIKKYYPTYGTSGVTKWYKITDRNWDLSREISPSTYKFSDDTGNNYYEVMMYFADNETPAKQINTDVNSFTTVAKQESIDWVNRTRPKWTDPAGKTNYCQVDKEHVWVKSHGFSPSGDPAQGAGTDLHHLIAADHTTNNIHNDLYYGIVADKEAKTTKEVYCRYGDGTHELSGWTGLTNEGEECFEPTDMWKGDVARAIFYMATNYSYKLETNTEAEPFLYISNGNDNADDNSHFHGVFHNLEDFKAWNELDPVSEYEKHRNNLIYYNVQNNRNPFVDHPEWVNLAFNENYELYREEGINNYEGDNEGSSSTSVDVTSEDSSVETTSEDTSLETTSEEITSLESTTETSEFVSSESSIISSSISSSSSNELQVFSFYSLLTGCQGSISAFAILPTAIACIGLCILIKNKDKN